MGFEESLVGFEDRVIEMINVLSVLIGLTLILLGMTSMFSSFFQATMYATLATAVLVFPVAVGILFKKESYTQSPPPIIKKKK